MEAETQKEGSYTIVKLSGEIDFRHSPQVREQVLAGLDEGQHLLVDLSAVSYIDSSGIASLVEGLQHARSKALSFGLMGVTEGVMGVLKLTRLDKVFPMFASLDEAMAAAR